MGFADRGASIRVPHAFVKEDAYKGYLKIVVRIHRMPLPDRIARTQDGC